jgi:SAM-dependent methyltransferase
MSRSPAPLWPTLSPSSVTLVNPGELLPSDILLLDRRKRELRGLRSADSSLRISSVGEYPSPLGPTVYVVKFARSGGARAPLPKLIRSATTIYRRVLDRFYLPHVVDPAISTALFDICASLYDTIIDKGYNLRNICELLETVVHQTTEKDGCLRILDFGCGSGLAAAAMRLLPRNVARRISIRGTDASPAMLALASKRGLQVLQFSEWQTMRAGGFDAAIASFVLHCGLLDRELRIIARQLTPGGIFVANYFGAGRSAVRSFQTNATSFGFRVIRKAAYGFEKNPILVLKARD